VWEGAGDEGPWTTPWQIGRGLLTARLLLRERAGAIESGPDAREWPAFARGESASAFWRSVALLSRPLRSAPAASAESARARLGRVTSSNAPLQTDHEHSKINDDDRNSRLGEGFAGTYFWLGGVTASGAQQRLIGGLLCWQYVWPYVKAAAVLDHPSLHGNFLRAPASSKLGRACTGGSGSV
jgi:hypothetical protein